MLFKNVDKIHIIMLNSLSFSIFTLLCNHYLYLVPKYIRYSRRKACVHQVLPVFSSFWPLTTKYLLSVSVDFLMILHISVVQKIHGTCI